MTKDAKNPRKNFTFRMKNELSDKVKEEANNLGISQTAYITMVLHKAIKQTNC